VTGRLESSSVSGVGGQQCGRSRILPWPRSCIRRSGSVLSSQSWWRTVSWWWWGWCRRACLFTSTTRACSRSSAAFPTNTPQINLFVSYLPRCCKTQHAEIERSSLWSKPRATPHRRNACLRHYSIRSHHDLDLWPLTSDLWPKTFSAVHTHMIWRILCQASFKSVHSILRNITSCEIGDNGQRTDPKTYFLRRGFLDGRCGGKIFL